MLRTVPLFVEEVTEPHRLMEGAQHAKSHSNTI